MSSQTLYLELWLKYDDLDKPHPTTLGTVHHVTNNRSNIADQPIIKACQTGDKEPASGMTRSSFVWVFAFFHDGQKRSTPFIWQPSLGTMRHLGLIPSGSQRKKQLRCNTLFNTASRFGRMIFLELVSSVALRDSRFNIFNITSILRILRLLQKAGADACQRTSKGRTALDFVDKSSEKFEQICDRAAHFGRPANFMCALQGDNTIQFWGFRKDYKVVFQPFSNGLDSNHGFWIVQAKMLHDFVLFWIVCFTIGNRTLGLAQTFLILYLSRWIVAR